MTADTPPLLVGQATEILRATAEAGIEARVLGGVAIYLRASEAGRAALGRQYGDIDLVAHLKQSRDLRALLERLGYVGQQLFNATHGERRLLYEHADPEHWIDVFLDVFEMSHVFDFSARLRVEPLTLPSADLLLTKLQIAEINAKDLSDCALLLLEHAPAAEDGQGLLNASYIAGLCGSDWGLQTTLTDNLEKLRHYLPSIALEQAQRDRIQDRIEALTAEIETGPKSLRWKARARIGRRVPWHETPEEIAHE